MAFAEILGETRNACKADKPRSASQNPLIGQKGAMVMSKQVLIILAWLCVLLVCPVMAANEADEDLRGFTLLGKTARNFWTGLQLGVGIR